jgi:Ribosomal protein S7p/S5e
MTRNLAGRWEISWAHANKWRLTGCFLCSDYIQIRSPVYLPHSAGRYAAKRFRKANCPIIERLTNSLMMHGRNNGKKLMAVRIVAHAFEIVRTSPED